MSRRFAVLSFLTCLFSLTTTTEAQANSGFDELNCMMIQQSFNAGIANGTTSISNVFDSGVALSRSLYRITEKLQCDGAVRAGLRPDEHSQTLQTIAMTNQVSSLVTLIHSHCEQMSIILTGPRGSQGCGVDWNKIKSFPSMDTYAKFSGVLEQNPAEVLRVLGFEQVADGGTGTTGETGGTGSTGSTGTTGPTDTASGESYFKANVTTTEFKNALEAIRALAGQEPPVDMTQYQSIAVANCKQAKDDPISYGNIASEQFQQAERLGMKDTINPRWHILGPMHIAMGFLMSPEHRQKECEARNRKIDLLRASQKDVKTYCSWYADSKAALLKELKKAETRQCMDNMYVFNSASSDRTRYNRYFYDKAVAASESGSVFSFSDANASLTKSDIQELNRKPWGKMFLWCASQIGQKKAELVQNDLTDFTLRAQVCMGDFTHKNFLAPNARSKAAWLNATELKYPAAELSALKLKPASTAPSTVIRYPACEAMNEFMIDLMHHMTLQTISGTSQDMKWSRPCFNQVRNSLASAGNWDADLLFDRNAVTQWCNGLTEGQRSALLPPLQIHLRSVVEGCTGFITSRRHIGLTGGSGTQVTRKLQDVRHWELRRFDSGAPDVDATEPPLPKEYENMGELDPEAFRSVECPSGCAGSGGSCLGMLSQDKKSVAILPVSADALRQAGPQGLVNQPYCTTMSCSEFNTANTAAPFTCQ